MLSIHIVDRLRRLSKAVKKQEKAWVVFFGLVAVTALGFEAGLITGKSGSQSAPLRIELAPVDTSSPSAAHSTMDPAFLGERIASKTGELALAENKGCVFVASRNSKLYHAASCAVVKRIKAENRLCFKEASEATARGLKPGCTQ